MRELKEGTIAWHQARIDEIRARHSKRAKAQHAKRRDEKEKKFNKGYNNNVVKNTKDPKSRYNSRIDYDFLMYIRIVFKWATENYPDLSRPEIEILLYLYGLGAFSKKQFNDYHKLVSLFAIKSLNHFVNKGYVQLWRPRKGKEYALYTLTQKAKLLCNKMHKYSCGLSEIPTNPISNNMYRKDAPRINNYYLDMIKRMNKNKAPK
jgi:hypothetical protein